MVHTYSFYFLFEITWEVRGIWVSIFCLLDDGSLILLISRVEVRSHLHTTDYLTTTTHKGSSGPWDTQNPHGVFQSSSVVKMVPKSSILSLSCMVTRYRIIESSVGVSTRKITRLISVSWISHRSETVYPETSLLHIKKRNFSSTQQNEYWIPDNRNRRKSFQITSFPI